jgi:molybdopterin molybdotransferase
LANNNQLLSIQEALDKIKNTIQPLHETELVNINSCLRRILSEDVFSPIPLPPFKSSAMDGFALKQSDWANNINKEFSILGRSLAGHPFQGVVEENSCVRIFTGAKIPEEFDLIILQEQIDHLDESKVSFQDHEPQETYVRPVGHDIDKDTQVAAKGQRIDPILLSRLSASGIHEIRVFKKLSVGVFSSGDELVSANTAQHNLQEGQIFESNRPFLLNNLENFEISIIDYGNIPDSKAITIEYLTKASKTCDLIITSGGVSVGEADFITETIAELGTLDFWRLNLKPGKPLAFGRINGCSILGLPGNPVSTIITGLLIANPLIEHMSGARPKIPLRLKATCQQMLSHSTGRTEYQRAKYVNQEDGSLIVKQPGDQSSNRLSSFVETNCLIEIPDSKGDILAGEQVTIIPLSELGLVEQNIN